MASDPRTIDDDLSIRIILQRLCLAGMKVSLAAKDRRSAFHLLAQEADRILVSMPAQALADWAMADGDKVSMSFEDRGFTYESVVAFKGPAEWEGIDCSGFSVPRLLLRADDFRLTHFAPETAPKVTFTNGRNTVLDGQIKGMGHEGFELTVPGSPRKVHEVLRMGEESTLDLTLEEDLRITAYAKVAYFGDDYVGMRFTDRVDRTVLGQYRSWLEGQQRLQAMQDQEAYESGDRQGAKERPAALPQVRVWVDRDPAFLILTEREDFARHMGEALGRKFGVLSLDYIKGPVRPFLAPGDGAGWGRIRLIVVHNHLRLSSPLELARQLVEQEKCPLPILVAGTVDDLELKRNRALAAGAVDYMPVEPFKILAVLRKLDETFKLFEG